MKTIILILAFLSSSLSFAGNIEKAASEEGNANVTTNLPVAENKWYYGGNVGFSFWNDYTNFCRNAAKQYKVSIRKFDKALWQYSAENQP